MGGSITINNGTPQTLSLTGSGSPWVYVSVLPEVTLGSGIFPTELLTGFGLLTGSPGGLMIRESPTFASLGQTTVTGPAGGPYLIDSLFSIFTELSMDGGNTWAPQNGGGTPLVLGSAPSPTVPEPGSLLYAVGATATLLVRRRTGR